MKSNCYQTFVGRNRVSSAIVISGDSVVFETMLTGFTFSKSRDGYIRIHSDQKAMDTYHKRIVTTLERKLGVAAHDRRAFAD
jgi:hypothetical protein